MKVNQSTWTSQSLELLESDFARFQITETGWCPARGHPDFSASGSPIQFGFHREDSTAPGSGGYSIDGGIDNVSITLRLNEPPVAACGDDIVVPATSVEGATVQLDGTASYDPEADSLQHEWAVPEGSGAVLDDPSSATPTGQFPIGPTLVTFTVTDGNGGIDVCDVLVTVQDTIPPVLVCTTDRIALWPPDHAMVPVQITIAVTDASSPEDLALLCYASSSEADD